MIVRIEHTTSGTTRELDAPPSTMMAALAAIAIIHPDERVSTAAKDALTWAEAHPNDVITDTRGPYTITIDTRSEQPAPSEPE